MSFIRPNAPSTVWKTFGATPRAWNGTRRNHARELTCSGGRVGCSASRKELHATRVPPQEMKSPLPPSIIAPIASSVEAAVPAGRSKTALEKARPLLTAAAGHATSVSPTSYGDLFGEAVADAAAEVAAAAAGDGTLASPGFALINSTSKMSVAFGPISPPVPPGP